PSTMVNSIPRCAAPPSPFATSPGGPSARSAFRAPYGACRSRTCKTARAFSRRRPNACRLPSARYQKDDRMHLDPALVVVGQGAAGLAAALAAAERAREINRHTHITIVDRAPAGQAGGGTRFSPANMRLADAQAMVREFEAIIAGDPRHDRAYFETLA